MKKDHDLKEAGDRGSFVSALPEPIDFVLQKEKPETQTGLDSWRTAFA